MNNISINLSVISMCVTLVLNYIVLQKNISFSYLGQYGDYSNSILNLGNEIFIPLFIAIISLVLGMLKYKKRKVRINITLGLALFAIILSLIPIWKVFFLWLKYY